MLPIGKTANAGTSLTIRSRGKEVVVSLGLVGIYGVGRGHVGTILGGVLSKCMAAAKVTAFGCSFNR